MLLDQLLANLGVEAAHVAVDEVPPGERLAHAPQQQTMVLFGLAGDCVVRDQHGEHALRQGWLGLVPPGRPFSVIAAAQPLVLACGALQVRYRTGEDVFADLPSTLTFDMTDNREISAAFEALVEEQRHPQPGSAFLRAALINQCLVAVFRAVCDDPNCSVPWLEALEDPQLAPGFHLILTQPGQHHTVDSLAAACHLSRSAFIRRFSERTGEPPMVYLRRVRMRDAARRLTAAEPVATVAKDVGYASRSRFGDAFRREFGCSPSQFREDAVRQ